MDSTSADLRSYYEQEESQRLRKPPTGRRVEVRERFLRLLADEARSAVLVLHSLLTCYR